MGPPYPATAYLTGFLRKEGYQVCQRDCAIDLFLSLLSKQGLKNIAQSVEDNYADSEDDELPESIHNFLLHYPAYSRCIEPVISFLQGKNPSLALRITSRTFLPEGPHFENLYQMEAMTENLLHDAFGTLGIQDKAKYLATLFMAMSSLIVEF